MSKLLDVLGLAGLVVAGGMVALPLGVAMGGAALLWVSWSMSRGER